MRQLLPASAPAGVLELGGVRRDLRRRALVMVEDVARALGGLIRRAEAAGIPPERVVVDPGLDLGKTWRQSLRLLDRMRVRLRPKRSRVVRTPWANVPSCSRAARAAVGEDVDAGGGASRRRTCRRVSIAARA